MAAVCSALTYSIWDSAEYFANIISFDAGKESYEIGTIFTSMQK